jgi:hypothetical protein
LFLDRWLKKIDSYSSEEIYQRVSYYNKINSPVVLSGDSIVTVGGLERGKRTTYFFDLRSVLNYFNPDISFKFLAGDIVRIPDQPTFLKSRPVSGDNTNSVILKLNKIRHYNFVRDEIPYREKKNNIVWRGAGNNQSRKSIAEKYYLDPRCNIGITKPRKGRAWEKDPLTIKEQLQYKFILCIEGRDVATSLKWVMSSSSLPVMARPKYETWFMEGKLVSGIHYAEVKDDYSDILDVMDYYLEHEDKALAIIENANAWVQIFQDKRKEKLIELLVAQKYFERVNCE